jgi:hypothetical protein
MKNLVTCLTLCILLTAASSCSKKADEIAPNQPPALRAYTANMTSGDDYERGRRLGASDALALAKSLSTACPDLGPNPTGSGVPTEGPGAPGTPSGGIQPIDTPHPVIVAPIQGGNSVCMSGYDQTRFDDTLLAWKDSALQHADASNTPEEAFYYNGYAQGIYEWQLPAR